MSPPLLASVLAKAIIPEIAKAMPAIIAGIKKSPDTVDHVTPAASALSSRCEPISASAQAIAAHESPRTTKLYRLARKSPSAS